MWDQDLAVEYANFDLTWTKFFQNQDESLVVNQIHFKVHYTKENQMYLIVDTLNGLRYVKQFCPEDSILSKLPR